jgi:hypothetical protein
LEIRLPRRQVRVAADEALVEDAVSLLIASGAAILPPGVPLHVAVWVERAQDEHAEVNASPVPPAMGIEQINTVLLKPGELPNLVPPTRAVSAQSASGTAQASLAVVRVCSPGLGRGGEGTRASLAEPQEFARCRETVTPVSGRAWAREDPLLGPTYSFSIPMAMAH